MKLYYGSNVAVKVSEIRSVGFYKDFGYGFYCMAFEKQARRRALIKHPEHIVSIYDYTPDEELKVLSFPSMTEAWLDFVVDCRRGLPHGYDIVEGPMADDTIGRVTLIEITLKAKITSAFSVIYFISVGLKPETKIEPFIPGCSSTIPNDVGQASALP